jgi:type IV pilus assembly protein PilO
MKLSLTKLPWYAQVGAFLGLSLAALAVFYFFYVSSVQTDMAARQQQLDGVRAEIAKGQATARKLPEFRTQVAELERRLESLKAVLPGEKEYGELLRRIQTLALQSNLTIRQFKPGAMTPKELHAEWPVNLELDGTYHNLGLFFDRIGKFHRIINLSGLSIRAKDKPGPTSTIIATCVATTFVLLETPAKQPAKPGTPGAPATPKTAPGSAAKGD